MAQPSVIHYFNSRKRPAIDDPKLDNNNKVLKLDQDVITNHVLKQTPSVLPPGLKKPRKQTVAKNVQEKLKERPIPKTTMCVNNTNSEEKSVLFIPKKDVAVSQKSSDSVTKELANIKKVISKSDKLNKLKESLQRFKKNDEKLKSIEKKTAAIPESPKLKVFKSLEIEVVSPQKVSSPEKPYLSPKKLPSLQSPQKSASVRRNLLNALSPTKVTTDLIYDPTTFTDTTTQTLQLPFKYRTLNEIFRAIDTVVQIMYNRKEMITFRKLKPAVEEMVKRTFFEKHLSQIKNLYPDAYNYTQGKEKTFGLRQSQWDLVVTPMVTGESMTTQILLDRRRHFYQILIDKTKNYHNEFLQSLTPPMTIPKTKITRWHPEFDLEKVPDIELATMPEIPVVQHHISGKEVLETARKLFNCNTRMDQALQRLKEQQKDKVDEPVVVQSVLKGIPKALLEKVRQKQAAKALISMTRTADKEKEVKLYSRLPELARLTRNLFVTEKKGVLELDVMMEKLSNSFRTTLSKAELEEHLKTISSEVPGWLVFHKLRNSVFLKLDKNADLSAVINKLEKLAIQKSET